MNFHTELCQAKGRKFCDSCVEPVFLKRASKAFASNIRLFHKQCAKCSCCNSSFSLIHGDSVPGKICLQHNGKLFCDTICMHEAPPIVRCKACNELLISNDMVCSLNNGFYHFYCLKCTICDEQLQTNDRLKVINDEIRCPKHYNYKKPEELPRIETVSEKRKKKLQRTYISDKQQEILLKYYVRLQYPTHCEVMEISKNTGLPFKTVRYWFQNRRSRETK